MGLLRILVVDDEEDFRELTGKRLARRGYTVRTAGSCQEALAHLTREPAEVVVLDVKLPDRDGIDCLVTIRERWPAVAVIMLTGHASVSAGLLGLERGASDYCLKPLELAALVEKIEIAARDRELPLGPPRGT
ncbi:MAG: response regulator [Thermodesulfobacteriota bacterium]